jgi:hypothetical protein
VADLEDLRDLNEDQQAEDAFWRGLVQHQGNGAMVCQIMELWYCLSPSLVGTNEDERGAPGHSRRIFEALCERYPDRYVVLVEQPGSTKPTVLDTTALSRANAIGN